MTSITSFRGKYIFLSNFYPSPMTVEGIRYATVEHAYQAAKTLDLNEKQIIADCEKPGQAKRLGKKVRLRKDWEQIKLNVMYLLLVFKFKNPELREKLLATGDRELIESNDWGDYFWGQCMGIGENHLGKLLMRVRSEIQ
jgi:ribA/ribD-fused uncharacterized protein